MSIVRQVRPVQRTITPWRSDEQYLLYKLYKEDMSNGEIAKEINKKIWDGKPVRDAGKVHNFIVFAIKKGWLRKTRVSDVLWTEEELRELVILATAPEGYSHSNIADMLNKKFHKGKKTRFIRSIEYGLDIAFQRGADPLMGVKEE